MATGKKARRTAKGKVKVADICAQAVAFHYTGRLLGGLNNEFVSLYKGPTNLPPDTPTPPEGSGLQATYFPTLSDYPPTTTPWIVNTAFAAELYLKSLAVVESDSHIREHNLSVLWDDLSVAIKDKARGSFSHHASQCDLFQARKTDPAYQGVQTIDACLRSHSQTFEDVRYAQEKESWHYLSLGIATLSLMNVLLELYGPLQELISRADALPKVRIR